MVFSFCRCTLYLYYVLLTVCDLMYQLTCTSRAKISSISVPHHVYHDAINARKQIIFCSVAKACQTLLRSLAEQFKLCCLSVRASLLCFYFKRFCAQSFDLWWICCDADVTLVVFSRDSISCLVSEQLDLNVLICCTERLLSAREKNFLAYCYINLAQKKN